MHVYTTTSMPVSIRTTALYVHCLISVFRSFYNVAECVRHIHVLYEYNRDKARISSSVYTVVTYTVLVRIFYTPLRHRSELFL